MKMLSQEHIDALFHQGDFDYMQMSGLGPIPATDVAETSLPREDAQGKVPKAKPARAGPKKRMISIPRQWDALVTKYLGAMLPVFGSMGNHDEDLMEGPDGYQAVLAERLRRSGADQGCQGEVGVNLACSFQGLFFVNSAIPMKGKDHLKFMEQAFKEHSDHFAWRFCTWHTVAADYTVSDNLPRSRQDDPTLAPYELCRQFGAFIVTGHDHLYARTHIMTDYSKRTMATAADVLKLKQPSKPLSADEQRLHEAYAASEAQSVLIPGRSFAIVNGLGGLDVRRASKAKSARSYWAARYHQPRPHTAGALVCSFSRSAETEAEQYRSEQAGLKVRYEPHHLMRCQLKLLNGEVADAFTVESDVLPPQFTDEEYRRHRAVGQDPDIMPPETEQMAKATMRNTPRIDGSSTPPRNRDLGPERSISEIGGQSPPSELQDASPGGRAADHEALPSAHVYSAGMPNQTEIVRTGVFILVAGVLAVAGLIYASCLLSRRLKQR